MGLGHGVLEWHEQNDGGWVARAAFRYDTNPDRVKYRRVAHVNIFGHAVRRTARSTVPVVYRPYSDNTLSWHDSIEAAKLYVEAMFALDD